MEHLQAFIADCDRRTEAAKTRLAETQEELTAEVAVKANAVHQLAEEIGKKLAKAEALGEAGQVEESVQLMQEIEELRAKKIQAEHEYRSSMPASSYQQQKLRVCEVCSAYLGIHDNDIRLADHFGGKLHLGFMEIRDKLKDLEVRFSGSFFEFGFYFSSFENRKLLDHAKLISRRAVTAANVSTMTVINLKADTTWVEENWIDGRVYIENEAAAANVNMVVAVVVVKNRPVEDLVPAPLPEAAATDDDPIREIVIRVSIAAADRRRNDKLQLKFSNMSNDCNFRNVV